ncbi:Ppx/GppA phosphatase family protein [Kutzneria sp. NPDC051319]|uniref:Ppx/GppA phosphatase family protein n=1 Tax=Kutzneria sp. NPDC051319 TaxID=3155047 RepID=UPI003422C150
MRLGVLDIGSNSAQLQVVDIVAGGPPLPAYAVKEPTLLAESFTPDGAIDRQGVRRAAEAVGRCLDVAQRSAVDKLYVFATSAVRDCANRDEVLGRIEGETGVRPQYLSGEDEARLTYLAARRWYGWSAGRLLVLDIGGGSMEIVYGTGVRPDLVVSLPLGAGRLTRRFLPDDLPSDKQLRRLRGHIRDELGEVADRLAWEGAPNQAVATSKTFKQLARLAGAPAQRRGPFVRRRLTVDDVARWVPRLARTPAAERADLRGVSRSRARQVVAGAMVAQAAMSRFKLSSVDVCPWALREGVVLCHAVWDARGFLPLQPISLGDRPVLHDIPRQLVVGSVAAAGM